MANYQWRALTDYQSTTTLSHGVTPNDKETWQTEAIGTPGSGTWDYWLRDSNTTYAGAFVDALSSRCNVSVTDSWTTSVDTLNNLTVTVTTTLNSIIRDDIRHPAGVTDQNTPGRQLTVYREQGGAVLGSWTDNQVATAHTIYSGPMQLASYSFTLAPGADTSRSSLFLHNQAVGQQSWDNIGLGVSFKNILPVAPTYSLVYNANGGTGAPATQTTQTNVGSVTFTVSNTTPTWGDFIFLGWSTHPIDQGTPADVEYSAGDTITLQESSPSLTLYAVWQKDYRPGERKVNGTWVSHNRSVGKCERKVNGVWTELRTVNGGVGTGNPPSRKTANVWYNQRKVGLE